MKVGKIFYATASTAGYFIGFALQYKFGWIELEIGAALATGLSVGTIATLVFYRGKE